MARQRSNLERLMADVVLVGAVFVALLALGVYVLVVPSYSSSSGPRSYGGSIAFATDSTFVAYVWKDASYKRRAIDGRLYTLDESLTLRVRLLGEVAREINVPLDSIDLRPDGISHFNLGVDVQSCPDSRHVAAVVSRRIVIVDTLSGQHREIQYPGESFGSLTWLSASELVFSSSDRKDLTFWRYKLDTPVSDRKKVYSEPDVALLAGWRTRDLREHQWSPNGRFVTFTSYKNAGQGENILLDVLTSQIHLFTYSLQQPCWKPDSSAFLVYNSYGAEKGIYVVNPMNGEARDISPGFVNAFGEIEGLSLESRAWTPDGNYIVVVDHAPNSIGQPVGFVVRPEPFEIILSTSQILRWSPVPDWFLLQGKGTFEWIDISGKRKAPIEGWVNNWIWSWDGTLAAKIVDSDLVVFKPLMPPGE